MRLSVPVVSVLGNRKSGKTTLISMLTSILKKRGLDILIAKHIAHREFTIDSSEKDTYKLRKCSGKVIYYADSGEVGLIIENFELNKLLEFIDNVSKILNVDLVILEGFSTLVLNVEEIAKIICVRGIDEIEYYTSRGIAGPTLICSLDSKDTNIVLIPRDVDIVVNFVESYMKVHDIYKKLGGLNCGKCGYGKCIKFAWAVYLGKEIPDKCVYYLVQDVKLSVDGKVIPVNKFVASLLKNLVKAFVASLKDVPSSFNKVEIHVRYGDESSGS